MPDTMSPPVYDDETLLRDLCAGGPAAQVAFPHLVRRHIDFVYSAAKRQVGHDAHLADDVTQAVFVLLDRKRPSVGPGKLPGWLFNTTRFVARNAVKMEMRRKKHERIAAEMRPEAPQPDPRWSDVGPVLDQAVSKLGAGERDVVLLHYFQNMTLADVARRLGISEVAARQRSSRAIGKLRDLLAKQGVACSTVGLAETLRHHAVTSAPESLATATATTGTATTAATSLATAATSAATIVKLKLAAAIVGAIAITGGGVVMVERTLGPKAAAPTASSSVAANDLTNFKTFHGVVTFNFPDMPQRTHEIAIDAEKGAVVGISRAGKSTHVETFDGTNSYRFREGADLVVKPEHPDLSLPDARRIVADFASWSSASPVRNPAADLTENGEHWRAYSVSHWRMADNRPATVWVDEKGVARRAKSTGPNPDIQMQLDVELDQPLPVKVPADLPQGVRVVPEAQLLEENYPLKTAVARADAASYTVAVHSARRDTAGNLHLVLSSRPTDAARPLVGNSPPGNYYVRPDGQHVKSALMISRLDIADASVREIVITPGPAASNDSAPFEFEVSVLPWGPVTGALQEKGMPISGMARLKLPTLASLQPAGTPAQALAADYDRVAKLAGAVRGGVSTETRGTMPITFPPGQLPREQFVEAISKKLKS